jgi:hypothetical protein
MVVGLSSLNKILSCGDEDALALNNFIIEN